MNDESDENKLKGSIFLIAALLIFVVGSGVLESCQVVG